MNALAELVAGWRKEAHKLRVDARSRAVAELPHLSDMAQAKAAGIESVLDELEAATVGAHLVRRERLAEVTLPESGEGCAVILCIDGRMTACGCNGGRWDTGVIGVLVGNERKWWLEWRVIDLDEPMGEAVAPEPPDIVRGEALVKSLAVELDLGEEATGGAMVERIRELKAASDELVDAMSRLEVGWLGGDGLKECSDAFNARITELQLAQSRVVALERAIREVSSTLDRRGLL